jgi:catechol 2,3-dioxygenase-like lactoylglutathione lyase family enzyme
LDAEGRRGKLADVEQRLSIVTLGVTDLARARSFYEALGWRGQEVEQTVFFQAGGMAIVLWGREKLADDAGVAASEPTPFDGMTLAHNVRSTEEVDAILATAQAAGATITRPAGKTFYGGYAGYFADPDGHLWEVAHNPGFTLEADGSLTLPNFAD